jgi:hypothetical protein
MRLAAPKSGVEAIKSSSDNSKMGKEVIAMSKSHLALSALACIVVAICAFPNMASADSAPPPDLAVSPADMGFEVDGTPVGACIVGSPVAVDVTVHNIGPGNSISANASFFLDGRFLALVPVPDMAAPATETFIRFFWDTGCSTAGFHLFQLQLACPGDANASNDNASAGITLYSMPSMSINLDENEYTVKGYNTSVNPILFTGNLTVNNTTDDNITVGLRTSEDYQSISRCEPGQMTFGPGNHSNAFNLTTWQIVLNYQTTGWVTRLDATAISSLFTMSGTANASVFFEPHYVVYADARNPYLDVASKKAEFIVDIENAGNLPDTYHIEVLNENEIRDKGWNVSLSDTTITLYPGETAELTVTATFTRGWPPVIPSEEPTVFVLGIISDSGGNNQTTQFVVNHVGYPGMPFLLITLAVAAATIFFAVLPVRWPGKRRIKNPKFALVMYTFSVFSATIGLYFILFSQGVMYTFQIDTPGDLNYSSSIGMGVLALPFLLPFLLAGTAVGIYFMADERTKGRVLPYVAILAIETMIVVGFMPFPMSYGQISQPGSNSGSIMVVPLLKNLPDGFLLLFCLLYMLGLSAWYLVRPESWPVKNWKDN